MTSKSRYFIDEMVRLSTTRTEIEAQDFEAKAFLRLMSFKRKTAAFARFPAIAGRACPGVELQARRPAILPQRRGSSTRHAKVCER